jgi:hypothetical protein
MSTGGGRVRTARLIAQGHGGGASRDQGQPDSPVASILGGRNARNASAPFETGYITEYSAKINLAKLMSSVTAFIEDQGNRAALCAVTCFRAFRLLLRSTGRISCLALPERAANNCASRFRSELSAPYHNILLQQLPANIPQAFTIVQLKQLRARGSSCGSASGHCASATNPRRFPFRGDARTVILGNCESRQYRPVADFKLLKDVMKMHLYGAVANAQASCNFLVR